MKTCPQCGYVRKESDAIIPATECPKCGIIYEKWRESPASETPLPKPAAAAEASSEQEVKSKASVERIVIAAVIAAVLLAVTVTQVIRYLRSEKQNPATVLVESESEKIQPASDRPLSAATPSANRTEIVSPARELSISDIMRDTRESVVVVKTGSTIGSGFFINRNGHIVTNRHVLPGGERAEIKTVNGSVFRVEQIVHEDAQADLVIVSTNASQQESKPVRLGGRLPDVGEKIIVIGSPLGLEQTVSDGIVSALRRNQHAVEFIQVTAPVSPGNSGGPLLNMRGEVIGVATFQFRGGQNLNFCVAASRIAGMQDGTNAASVYGIAGDVRSPGRKDVYCYADSGGHVSFVDWQTGIMISRPDGTLDRVKYESWVMEQIGGHPDSINPDKEAREDLDRNREMLYKTVFPHRAMDDPTLTGAEKDWLERRYQRHYAEVYNKTVMRRNEAIRKYRSMMYDFEKFAASRKQ